MIYRMGDIVKMKKSHPCGTNEWMLLRTGVDMKLECQGCKKIMWMKRVDFNKRVRKIKNEDGKFVSIVSAENKQDNN